MKRLHVIGRKNSGKTTLIVELVQELIRRGHRVGTVKHTHHDHELDTPGKDSHQHRQAGAFAVGILSSQINAVFWPRKQDSETKTTKYEQFDSLMSQCDLVVVEGDSSTIAPKIEVYRAINGVEPMALSDSEIMAVVTDDPIQVETATWSRADVSGIAGKIEQKFQLS